jgi:hypothetical protein
MTNEIIENTVDAVNSSNGAPAELPPIPPPPLPPPPVVDDTESSGEPVEPNSPPAVDPAAPFQLPDRPADTTDTDWYKQLADNHQYLHTEIAAIAPIDGISGGMQDIRGYQISFKPEATEEQRAAANAALLTLPEKLKKTLAHKAGIAAIDQWFNEQIETGFTGPNNIKMGLKTADIALLTGNFIMSQQAVALGMPLPPLMDMNGLAHFFANIEELTQVMLAYGQHRANLAMIYAARKAALDAEFAAAMAPPPDFDLEPPAIEPTT